MAKAWLLRPYPHNHDICRLDYFRENNLIAIGWPGIQSLAGKSRDQIKEILEGPPYNLQSLQLGNAYATIDLLVNQMQPQDYVLVPNGDEIYFAKITSSYEYDPEKDNDDEGFPHQRKVTWLRGPISRSELPAVLRNSLKVHRTTADLSKHYDIIKAFAEGTDLPYQPSEGPSSDFIVADYPIRPGVLAKISIPQDITQTEASRLGDFVKTLFFK